MPGLVGGHLDGSELIEAIDSMQSEDWYGDYRFESGNMGLGLVHLDSRDRNGYITWEDGKRSGVVYGVIPNLDKLDFDRKDLFTSVLEHPSEILSQLDGPFALATFDSTSNHLVVATDKIESRSIYYTKDNSGFVFASELSTILENIDEFQIDIRGVRDMLSYGYLVGEKTLVKGIKSLQPATYLSYRKDEASLHRYFWPEFGSYTGTLFFSLP